MNTRVRADASLAAAAQRLRSSDFLTTRARPVAPPANPSPRATSVGIVVPAYRGGAFLGMALSSIREQTYPYWRCVIVDDASPEDVGAVAAPFVRSDHRFRLLRHGANGGLSAARNTGLRNLDTDLVLFLDADDMLVPDALKNAVAVSRRTWQQPAVAGVHGQVVLAPNETTLEDLRSWTGRSSRHRVNWATYTGECPFNVHSVVLQRSVVDAFGGFDELFRDGAEDWDLWFRLLRHGFRFEPNPHLMGAYRQHGLSMFRADASGHNARAAQLFDAADCPALLDPTLKVGLGGAVPLSRARLGVVRAKRAASRIGMEIGATGALSPVDTSDAYALLDPGALTEGGQIDVSESAKNGMVRGLGITRAMAVDLPAELQQRINDVAALITASIVKRVGQQPTDPPTYDARPAKSVFDVLFLAESAADAVVLKPMAREVHDDGRTAAAVDLEVITGNSGANAQWNDAGIDVVPFHSVAIGNARARDVVGCAPVGRVPLEVFESAGAAGSRCHLVRVDNRTAGLARGGGSAHSTIAAAAARAISAELRRPRPRTRLDVSNGDPRRSKFSSDLVLDDGPLDAASADRILKLRDRHLGETCALVGNGDSLTRPSIALLSTVPVFGGNEILLVADRLSRPISFYLVDNPSFFNANRDRVKSYDAEWKFFCAAHRFASGPDGADEHTLFLRMNDGFSGGEAGTECRPGFSFDPSQRVFGGDSAIATNLQLAHWLGFQRVVLLGVDPMMTSVPDTPQRDDHPKDLSDAGQQRNEQRRHRALASLQLADEIYRATGREIIDATEGKGFDLFERQSLGVALDGVESPR